jgi:hypothetical protein
MRAARDFSNTRLSILVGGVSCAGAGVRNPVQGTPHGETVCDGDAAPVLLLDPEEMTWSDLRQDRITPMKSVCLV